MDFGVALPMPFAHALAHCFAFALAFRGGGAQGLRVQVLAIWVEICRQSAVSLMFVPLGQAAASFSRQHLALLVLTLELRAAIGGFGGGVRRGQEWYPRSMTSETDRLHRLGRPPLVGALEGRGHLAHETVHLFLDLRMRLQAPR